MADTTRALPGNGHDEPSSPSRQQIFSCTLDYRAGGSILDSIPETIHDSAEGFCLIDRAFGMSYYWSVNQCKCATDIVSRIQAGLQLLYENFGRTAIRTVKPDNIARLPGVQTRRSLPGRAGKSSQCPHRRKADQTHHGAGIAEALRHVRSQSAH